MKNAFFWDVSILPSTFRMYTRLITRIETTCSRLGKDDKFQLFICLAVHDRLLGRIVTDLTKAVAAQQVKLLTNHGPITVLFEWKSTRPLFWSKWDKKTLRSAGLHLISNNHYRGLSKIYLVAHTKVYVDSQLSSTVLMSISHKKFLL